MVDFLTNFKLLTPLIRVAGDDWLSPVAAEGTLITPLRTLKVRRGVSFIGAMALLKRMVAVLNNGLKADLG